MSRETMRQRIDAIIENTLSPAYFTSKRVAAIAQQQLADLKPAPPPAEGHPLDTGVVSETWIRDTIERETNQTLLEKRRGVLLTLVRDGRARVTSLADAARNDILNALNGELEA